jgi:hypothetical protein
VGNLTIRGYSDFPLLWSQPCALSIPGCYSITTMALRIAEQTGITLVALARSDSITVYANPGRIRGRAEGARCDRAIS